MVKYTNSTTSGIYRIVSDHLGRPRMVVNASSASDRLLEVRYSAFGIPTVISGSLAAIPFGFAGGLYDADTGLVRFGARDYDARFGRWTHKDPILFKGKQANLYVYVGNDPVNFVDPEGLIAGVPDWLEDLDNSGWLQAAGDFSAGVSSALTFGGSDLLIEATGLDEQGSTCSMARGLGELSGMVLGAAAGGEFAIAGKEISLGRNLRLGPFGNRTGHRFGKWPHYHRRGSGPGQGIGRHRPFEGSRHDRNFWGRF